MTKTERSLASWTKRGRGKTIFVNFDRHHGQEILSVGHGTSPTCMSGGVGVPVGMSFNTNDPAAPPRSRSYLILAFDNDYSGPELAEFLGGVSKRFRGPKGENDEEMMMVAFAKGALDRAMKPWPQPARATEHPARPGRIDRS